MSDIKKHFGNKSNEVLGLAILNWNTKYSLCDLTDLIEVVEAVVELDQRVEDGIELTLVEKRARESYHERLQRSLVQTYISNRKVLPTLMVTYTSRLDRAVEIMGIIPPHFFDQFQTIIRTIREEETTFGWVDCISAYNSISELDTKLASYITCHFLHLEAEKLAEQEANPKVVHVKFGGNRGKNNQPLPPTAS